MTDERTPEDIAIEASKPAKFSLIDRLVERNMPTEDVSIYLDENAAYHLMLLEEEHADTKDSKRLAEIEAEMAERRQAVLDSKVVLTLKGISNKRYDELVAEVEEIYPKQYETIENPFTGVKSRHVVANEEAELYFNRLFLATVLTHATFGGAVDDEINVKWIENFEQLAPLDAVRVLTAKAFKMRMVGQWMDGIQNEDFSPKP